MGNLKSSVLKDEFMSIRNILCFILNVPRDLPLWDRLLFRVEFDCEQDIKDYLVSDMRNGGETLTHIRIIAHSKVIKSLLKYRFNFSCLET